MDSQAHVPVTIRLQIEVRMNGGKRRYEVWTRNSHAIKTAMPELSATDLTPFILEKRIDTPFGVSVKRQSFTIESLDPVARVVTFRQASYPRSDWFYRNIQNFDFEIEAEGANRG